MEKKFNKCNVSEIILSEIERLAIEFNFNPNKGSAQIIGKNNNTHIAYGRYDALLSLHEEIFGNDKKFYSLS